MWQGRCLVPVVLEAGHSSSYSTDDGEGATQLLHQERRTALRQLAALPTAAAHAAHHPAPEAALDALHFPQAAQKASFSCD